MLYFDVTVEAAVETLTRISRKLKNLREFYEDNFYPKILRDFDKIFESEGRPTWAALSEKYAEYKARHYPLAGILERSGDLRDSYTISSHPDHNVEITNRTISVYSSVEYASLHESGTGNMPDRPVVGAIELDTGLRNQYNKLLRRHVQKVIRESQAEASSVSVKTSKPKRNTSTLTGRRKIRSRKRTSVIRVGR